MNRQPSYLSGSRALAPSPARLVLTAWAAIALLLGGSGLACNSRAPIEAARPQARRIVMIGPPAERGLTLVYESAAKRYVSRVPQSRFEYIERAGLGEAAVRAAFEKRALRDATACIIWVSDDAEARELLEWEKSLSIIVVTFGDALPPPVSSFRHARTDAAAGAELLAGSMRAVFGDRQSYALIHHGGQHELTQDALRRFQTLTEAAGNPRRLVEIEVKRGERWTRAIDAAFEQFPSCGAIVTLSSAAWRESPAVKLPDAAGYLTLGAEPTLWNDLLSGRALALAGPLDGFLAAEAARAAFEELAGGDRDRSTIIVPCELVTRKTLPDFAKRYAEAAGVELKQLAPELANAPGD